MADTMRTITLSGSLEELAHIYGTLDLNALHEAALCSRLAHLPSAPLDSQPLFFAVAHDWLKRPSSCDGKGARQAANLLWAAAKLGFAATSPVVPGLVRETVSLARDLDAQQASIALHALATLKYPVDTVLLDRARQLSTSSGAQTAANTLWAVSSLGVEDIELFAAAAARVSVSPDFLARHGSMSLWGLATASKMGVQSPLMSAYSGVVGDACSRLRFGFSAQEASITLWAASTLLLGLNVFISLLGTCAHVAQKFSPQNAANALWSIAHYKVSTGNELPTEMNAAILVISQRAHELRQQMNAQEIANCLWSSAILGIPLWLDFAVVAAERAPVFNERQAAMALYGFSIMSQGNIAHAYLAKALCQRTVAFEAIMSAEGSVLCLLSAVALKLSAQLCVELGFTSSIARLSDAGLYSSSQLVKVMHSLSRLSIGGDLTGHVVAAAIIILPSFSPGSIISFLQASAALAVPGASLEYFLTRALFLVKECSQKDVCGLLWVLALLGETKELTWRLLSDSVCASGARDINALDAQQLLFAHSACPFSLLDDKILDRCRSLVSIISREPHVSEMQRQVAKDLADLGFSTQLEATVYGTDTCVDIVARRGSSIFVVEVDGPTHFLTCPSTGGLQLNGSTLCRNALLRRRGHNLRIVPFFHWDTLRTPGERSSFLASLMVL